MLALGSMIDERYRVEQLLGRGGMADVYRAVDTEGDRPVALKLLRDVHAEHLHRFRSRRQRSPAWITRAW